MKILNMAFAAVCHISTEQRFSEQINKENLRNVLKYFTSKAHPAGSFNDHEQALWTKERLESYGLETHIEEYEPLLTFPLERKLIIKEPVVFQASLREAIVPEDESSFDQDAVPTFLGYSANGNLTDASLVYANKCDIRDFEALAKSNITVKGNIVLCRYGGAFRGLKVRAAEVNGAAGCLIYSDPIDDGFCRGEVYPKGPYRPETSVQRGSVQYANFYSGDPLTPFVAAKKNVPRLNLSEANIPKIPALPLSYGDASVFLKAIRGAGVIASSIDHNWQGGLDFDYWTGPSGKVDLFLKHEFKIKPIWNVISAIPGHKEPDRVILFGNHRDAWVNGAVDPNSGTTILLEIARIFGKMYKEGWKPARTIMFASWDGEEYGLLGSTEWVEDRIASLNKTLIAYINIDQGVYGKFFKASATPSLQTLIYNVTKGITDPFSPDKTVYDTWLNNSGAIIKELGLGSDYVPFVHQIGVASMDVRFEGPYGVYHSNYDSMYWMEHFGDPQFNYHAVLVEITGKIILSLSESIILPFDYSPYLKSLKRYLNDVKKEFIEQRVNYDLSPIEIAIQSFEDSLPIISQMNEIDQSKVKLLNEQLAFAERFFLDINGISGRAWYRHVIYAPGEWTGYAALIFPGIYEALERKRKQEICDSIIQVAASIQRVADFWKTEDLFH